MGGCSGGGSGLLLLVSCVTGFKERAVLKKFCHSGVSRRLVGLGGGASVSDD